MGFNFVTLEFIVFVNIIYFCYAKLFFFLSLSPLILEKKFLNLKFLIMRKDIKLTSFLI